MSRSALPQKRPSRVMTRMEVWKHAQDVIGDVMPSSVR